MNEVAAAPFPKQANRIGLRLALGLLLALVVVAVYFGVCGQEFLSWDDNVNIYKNPFYQPVSIVNTLYFWTHFYNHTYRPLTHTVWAGLAALASVSPPMPMTGAAPTSFDPHVFKVANLLLHIFNALWVYAILLLLVRSEWPALAGALLFAVHPVQVETVAWITGLNDLLCAACALPALWLYLAAAQRYEASESDSDRSAALRLYFAGGLCFVLALLAKPAAVALPLLAWSLDRWALRRSNAVCRALAFPWLALAVLWTVVTQIAHPPENTALLTPLWGRPLVATDALSFYLFKFVWPLNLCHDYGRTPDLVLRNGWVALSVLPPLLIALLAWQQRRDRPWLAAGLLVFVAWLIPVLGLAPFRFQVMYSTVADRYLYLSLLGPAYLLAIALSRHQARALQATCVVWLLLLCVRSNLQTRFWQNNFTFFEHALTVNPSSWMAHANLGVAYQFEQAKSSDPETRDRDRRAAIEQCEDVLLIKPDQFEVRTLLGSQFAAAGQIEAARAQFAAALKVNPDYAPAMQGLAALTAVKDRP